MKPVSYSPAALTDLRGIGRYIAEDDPDRALTFVDELRTKAQIAAERPFSFPARDDLAPGLRSIVHGRYLIFFRDLPDAVRIERVIQGARDLRALLGE